MVATTSGLLPLGLRVQANFFLSHIHVKEHRAGRGAGTVAAADGPSSSNSGGGTLFCAGLPLGMGPRSLEHAMACFGDVAQVVLHGSKRSGMVVFESAASVAAALDAARDGQIIELAGFDEGGEEGGGQGQAGPGPSSTAEGLRAWVNGHKAKRPGNAELQHQLDTWVAQHEEEEAAAERAQQAAMAEDGWTVVVRSKGRKRTKEGKSGLVQSGGMAAAAAQAFAKDSKAAPLEDFYRFQQREKRRSELVDLRLKFEADKGRISELRAARNLKPF